MSTGGTVHTILTTGLVSSISPGTISILAEGFYEIWLYSPTGGVALLRGLHFVWAPVTRIDINYAANSTTFGITPAVVGEIYSITGTLQASSSVVLEAAGPGTPTAYLEVYTPSGTLIHTFESSGTYGREAITVAAPLFMPESGFYQFRLYGDAVTTSVGFLGMHASIIS